MMNTRFWFGFGPAAALLLAGCPGDDTTPADEASSSSSETGGDPSGDPTTAGPTTNPTTTIGPTTTDPDTGSTTTDPDPDSSSGSSTDPDSSSSTSAESSDSSSSDGGSSTTDPTGESSSTGDVPSCADETLAGTSPESVVGSNVGAGDDSFGSCTFNGVMGGLDYSYEWTAPAAGRYVFTTNSPTTTFDTVLYLLDQTCDGTELVCSEDVPENTRSTLIADLGIGQTVIVVVDAYGNSNGAFELRIFEAPPEGTPGGSCCEGDAGMPGCDVPTVEECACAYDNACCDTDWDGDCVAIAILGCAAMCDETACVTDSLDSDVGDNVANGTNLGAGDDVTASCNEGGGEEATYSWTAPSTGLFELSTLESDFDTVLSVSGPSCLLGEELVCADAVGGESTLAFFASGQEAFISIEGYDGATGNYQLDINAYTPDLACAIEGDLGMATGDDLGTGDTTMLADDYTPSCGGATGADAIYTWTAPADGDYTFSLVGGTDYDAVLALSFGCELADGACSDTFAPEEITATLQAGMQIVIVIDGYEGETGNYTLSINPA